MEYEEPLFIIKQGNKIIWKTLYLSVTYNIITLVAKSDTIKCSDEKCAKSLIDIKEGEEWICLTGQSVYYCPVCYSIKKPRIDSFYYNIKCLKKKIPYKLTLVQKSIESHQDYEKLDLLTKMQYDACIHNTNRDNNKYIRELWYYLYHGKEKPI